MSGQLTDEDAKRRIWCMFGDSEKLYRRARLIYVGRGLSSIHGTSCYGDSPVYFAHDGSIWSHCRECTSEELELHGLTQPLKSWPERVTQWAKDRNIIGGTTAEQQFLKLVEEVGELAIGLQKRDMNLIRDSLGDIPVMVNNIAEILGMTFDECLEAAWEEIKDRKGKIVNGVFVKEVKE